MKRLIVLLASVGLLSVSCGLPNCEELANQFGLSDQVRYPLIGTERMSRLAGDGSWSFFGGGMSFETGLYLLVTLRLSDSAALVKLSVSNIEFVFDGSFPPEALFQWRAIECSACEVGLYDAVTAAGVLEVLLDHGGKVTLYLTEDVYSSQVQVLLGVPDAAG